MIRIMRACLFASLTALSGAVPAAPCGGFVDVDDTNPSFGSGPGSFCWGVEWMRNRAITIGCVGGTHYCPFDFVTRAQMALFMARLGQRLSPERFFVEQNPGVKVIQGGALSFNNLVCPTPGGSNTYPRRAFVRGLVWGLVDGPVVWGADVWVSMDGGTTYNWATYYIPGVGAPAAGMTHGNVFASIDLAPGNNYVFAILVRELPDGPNGSGNFSDLACQVQVEIHNGTSPTSPFDVASDPPQGGWLVANQPQGGPPLTADR